MFARPPLGNGFSQGGKVSRGEADGGFALATPDVAGTVVNLGFGLRRPLGLGKEVCFCWSVVPSGATFAKLADSAAAESSALPAEGGGAMVGAGDAAASVETTCGGPESLRGTRSDEYSAIPASPSAIADGKCRRFVDADCAALSSAFNAVNTSPALR